MPDRDIDTLLERLAAGPRRRPPLHLIGTKRFELRHELGSGGFGDVYEARDREHGTLVALKSLKSSHPDWIYRFKREFRIVGDLAHPNLVRLYELFLEDERWYLTMELVDGLRFDEYLRRAPDQLRSCFGQLALGIVELHRAGCLHRDLKPSNALVEATGRVVLLDFGLAVNQRANRNSAVAGTPPYMAPELGLGQPPSAPNDWYAFGVMLYDALAGELPFTGNAIEILDKKLGPPPRRPSQIRTDVDAEIEDLAMRLLSRAPNERPTGEEVLRTLLGGEHRVVDLGRRDRPSALAGRRRELAALAEAVSASARKPVVVTVRGGPGLGKTSLVATFLESLRGTAQVYQGRCLELESVPFKGVDGAIDMLCNDLRHRRYEEAAQLIPDGVVALAQMFPMVKRIEAYARHLRADTRVRSPQEARTAAAASLRDLLAKLAKAMPVVLFDDDLQWSSEDSVRLLLDLLRSPAPPVLLVVAFRDEAGVAAPVVTRFLEGLAELGIERVDLPIEPLDSDGIGELLAQHPGTQLSVEQAHRETGGHPYLLTTLIERGADARGPVELASILAEQLVQLDASARRLLQVVAVAGGPISPRAAFEAAGLRRDPATVDQLRRRRLIHGSTSTNDALLEAYHDRVRDIAVAELADDDRRDLHLRIATALATIGLAEPETLARHYREGRDRERALTWTRRAARQAASTLAFGRAVELHADAAQLAGDDAERIELLAELSDANVQAGRRNEAGNASLEAAALAITGGDEVRAAALRARAGELFLLGGQLERGLDLLRDVLAAVGVSLPVSPAVAVAESFNVGGVLATRGLGFTRRDVSKIDPHLLQRIDLQLEVTRALLLTDLRAPLIATRALLDALEAGEATRVQRALSLFVLSNSARSPQDPLVIAADARAHDLADDLADELGIAWAHMASGLRAMQNHAFPLAVDSLQQAEQLFLAGSLSHAREATFARVAILTICGNYCVDLGYAHRHLADVEEDALARGDLFGATWAQLTRCFVSVSAGDTRAARASLGRARSVWPRATDSLFAAMCLIYELTVEEYEDPGGSFATLGRIEAEFRSLFTSFIPLPRGMFCWVAGTSAISAWTSKRADKDVIALRITALLDELRSSLARAAYIRVLESFERALAGDPAGRIESLELAAADWERTRQPALAACARLRAAQFSGDTLRAQAMRDVLRGHAIADPDRFALVLVGPGP